MEKKELDQLREGVLFAGRGGGVRSAASIGVLRALEKAEIPVKAICGESGSSLVAALYAYGYNAKDVLDLFVEYSGPISKAAKIYGGRGAIVVEQLVNQVTNSTKMKDLPLDCWINACQGKLRKPELYLFSKTNTPEETLGFACSSSAGLPVFYGNTYKEVDGKRIKLFDGGILYNPYIPATNNYPVIYSSFLNTINYQKHIPFLQKPVDAVMEIADVTINTPVGGAMITGDSELIRQLEEAGYQETKKVLEKTYQIRI